MVTASYKIKADQVEAHKQWCVDVDAAVEKTEAGMLYHVASQEEGGDPLKFCWMEIYQVTALCHHTHTHARSRNSVPPIAVLSLQFVMLRRQ